MNMLDNIMRKILISRAEGKGARYRNMKELLDMKPAIQCESQKRKPRFNFISLKNEKTDHRTNNR